MQVYVNMQITMHAAMQEVALHRDQASQYFVHYQTCWLLNGQGFA